MRRTPPPHGSRSRYTRHKCRCPRCRAANAAYTRATHNLKRDAYGGGFTPVTATMWRLRALVWAGWTQAELANRLGWPYNTVQRLIHGQQQHTTHPERNTQVAALFDELAMRDGGSVRARNYAKARGWPPPLALDEAGLPVESCARGHFKGSRGECAECRRQREREHARRLREGGVCP